MRILLATALTLLLLGCYEDSTGCLNPDAANYDLLADLACPDCCTFPELSVRVTPVWNDTALVAGQTYVDEAGNEFQFVNLRYYLGDIRLEEAGSDLPDPLRPVDLRQRLSGDSAVTLNGNYLLASLNGTTTTVGTIVDSGDGLTGLSLTYGLADRYRDVIPSSAPAGDALRTQAGLLNFNDGRGYVRAKFEYTRGPGTDTLTRVSYGSQPYTLGFGQPIAARNGFDVRVDLRARLDVLIGGMDLARDSATVADQLGRNADFLEVTGLTL